MNNYLEAPYPTLAGHLIFDSKIEPVEDWTKEHAFPCVVVYTDYDKDQWTKSGRTYADRTITLTLELLVVQRGSGNGVAGDPYKLECPATDSEVETTLDILEAQVFRSLSASNEAADAFNYLGVSYVNTVSRRGASIEGGLRLAARQITLEMKTVRETYTTIPKEIEAFLAKLETANDYKDRVKDFRKVLLSGANETPVETVTHLLGYSLATAARLGAPEKGFILPPDIKYILSGGEP
ncbi:hypothetical protein [Pseudochrobactrum asaccharolyticum]